MAEDRYDVPDDAHELIRALEENAARQKQLTAELEQVKSRRTALIGAARDRRLLTWRRIAAIYDMTQEALQMASRKSRP